MSKGAAKRFVDEAKRFINEDISISRFGSTIENIQKLQESYVRISEENKLLKRDNEGFQMILTALSRENEYLQDNMRLLEEVLNRLPLIVSVRDVKKRSLLWYNRNFQCMLGYRHKELQELINKEAVYHYHPDDYRKVREREKFVSSVSNNCYSCNLRLKHIDGRYVNMQSDYFVLKRNADGSHREVIEILSAIE